VVLPERGRDARLDAGERKLTRRTGRREGDAMSEFLNAIKVDLLDSRRRPILAALVVAFVAALAYALLGGGSSSPSLSPLPFRPGSSGIPVSQAPANANQAVAETTSGASEQRTGSSRNPFAPLPGAGLTTTPSTATATATATAPSLASSLPAATQPGSSVQGGGGTSSGTGTQKASTPKVLIRYHVTAQLGLVPPPVEGAPPQP